MQMKSGDKNICPATVGQIFYCLYADVRYYTIPCAIIARATLRKPATFAPFT